MKKYIIESVRRNNFFIPTISKVKPITYGSKHEILEKDLGYVAPWVSRGDLILTEVNVEEPKKPVVKEANLNSNKEGVVIDKEDTVSVEADESDVSDKTVVVVKTRGKKK